MLSGEATNTIFIVFGLTRPGLEPTIYGTRGDHTEIGINTLAVCALINLEQTLRECVALTNL